MRETAHLRTLNNTERTPRTGRRDNSTPATLECMKILVTAFDPFGEDTVNPALEVARRLPPQLAGAEIVTCEVPTEFGRAIPVAVQAITEQAPDAVVCLGQAGGRVGITPERVAINLNDARIPDNAGQQPIDEPITPDGPPAYFATLPVKAMTQALRDAGIPAALSNTAGTFVCNHLMYGVLHWLATTGRHEVRAGFVHIPYLPEQAAQHEGAPSLSLAEMVRGVEAALAAIVKLRDDLPLVLGETH